MGPFPGNRLAARIADLTPDLQVLLSCGSTVVSFHSRQSFYVSFFLVCLGLPAPRLPSICISYAVLIAPLKRATCPDQQSLLSLKMRSRSTSWSLKQENIILWFSRTCKKEKYTTANDSSKVFSSASGLAFLICSMASINLSKLSSSSSASLLCVLSAIMSVSSRSCTEIFSHFAKLIGPDNTLVNVCVDLVVFTPIAGTS